MAVQKIGMRNAILMIYASLEFPPLPGILHFVFAIILNQLQFACLHFSDARGNNNINLDLLHFLIHASPIHTLSHTKSDFGHLYESIL